MTQHDAPDPGHGRAVEGGPAPTHSARDEPPAEALRAALARLRTVREPSAPARGDGAPVADDEPTVGRGPGSGRDTASGDAGVALGRRLEDRRAAGAAARHLAAVYEATHGHALAAPDAGGGPHRWRLRGSTALVALVAVLGVGLGAGAVALRPGGEVRAIGTLAAGAPSAPAVPAAPTPPAPPGASAAPTVPPGPVASDGSTGAPAGTVVVHVVGQVGTPGLVTVPAGARVADAVDAAGGATPQADLGALNLARPVVDGEQLRVPAPGEAVAPVTGPGGGAPAAGPGTPAADGAPAGPVDLNTADAAALDTLPGVGPVIAERIVAWRAENGRFTSVDELLEVSGIGPALLAKLRDAVRV